MKLCVTSQSAIGHRKLDQLPKLLYLGDVPVESTVYGAALLHRLLAAYPPGKLLILEGNPWKSKPEHRLASVKYGSFPLGHARLLNSRCQNVYGSCLFARAQSRWRRIDKTLGAFSPEAVVTVTHGYSWLSAADYARRKRLPLHLILHDDWPGHNLVVDPLRAHACRLLEKYYRHAASRLCISTGMAETYEREFSTAGTVLYPCAEPGVEGFSEPPKVSLRRHYGPVIGFGGTINGSGQARTVKRVAQVLAGIGGKLLIYGPLTQQRTQQLGLNLPNIELKGLVHSLAMQRAFRESAQALLVPLSFDEADRRQVSLSFPSKLADYTATGIPLLVVAPEYSSAAQWAKVNPGIGELVTVEEERALKGAIMRLASLPHYQLLLGKGALAAHEHYFSHRKAWETLREVLGQTPHPGRLPLPR